VPEFEDDSIREIFVRAYRIVYRVTHDKESIETSAFGMLEEVVDPNYFDCHCRTFMAVAT